MSKITVYHGSDHIVREPEYLGGKPDNDYGNGFYTTEYEERAKSWALLNGNPGKAVVNVYELDLDGLTVFDLNDHGILAWIAEVVKNRGVNQEAAMLVGKRLAEKYRADVAGCDIIKGYRADDSYTQVIEAFLLNQLNIEEVKRLFYKGSLGNQVFLKSQKAFEKLHFVQAYEVSEDEADTSYDRVARCEVSVFLNKRLEAILVEGYIVPGITAQYAVRHNLIYEKEGDFYGEKSV